LSASKYSREIAPTKASNGSHLHILNQAFRKFEATDLPSIEVLMRDPSEFCEPSQVLTGAV